MFVEKSKSTRAICSICNERITDEYRIYLLHTTGKVHYHINCIIKTGDALKSASYKRLLESLPNEKKFIKVTKL